MRARRWSSFSGYVRMLSRCGSKRKEWYQVERRQPARTLQMRRISSGSLQMIQLGAMRTTGPVVVEKIF